MKTNLLKEGPPGENTAEAGVATRGKMRERAVELAASDGRPAQDASKTDWERAKRELTGDPQAAVAELVVLAPSLERIDARNLSNR